MKRNFYYCLVVALMTVFAWSCGEDRADDSIPMLNVEVTTHPVVVKTASTAECGGVVVTKGTVAITARGVCWATQNTPTLADAKSSDGTGAGEFTSSISGLEADKVYYVRAYATTAAGTAYGKAVSFTAGVATPTVTTAEVTEVSYKTATGGGTIANAGVAEVVDCGICWSKEENPTTEDANVMGDPKEATFSLPMENLESGTTYYVRAFAISEAGTGYGEQVQFTTLEESLVTLPDANFMKYCLDSFDLNFDGKLQASEAVEVTKIDCSELGIASLEGITQFTNLETLMANDNPLTTVEVSGNQKLVRLELIRTEITSLNVTGMPQLEAILCDCLKEDKVGPMTSLSVSKCPVLTDLFCQENNISTLSISECPELKMMNVSRNALTALDLSSLTRLEELSAWDNRITSLDLTNNKALKKLMITRNRIKTLVLKDLPLLEFVSCDGLENEQVGVIQSLTMTNCAALKELWCQENSIETLSVTGCPALEKVVAWRNKLTALDLSNAKSLKTVQVGANQLSTANFSGCSSLDLLDIPANRLTTLTLAGCTALREVWMQENKMLTSVDLSSNKALQTLRCMASGIQSLDLSNLTALTSVWCDGNGMESVKATGCTALVDLKCQVNKLTSLDVQGCTALVTLWADTNNLSSLNLSNCSLLKECNIQVNRTLSSLNVTGCVKLANLSVWDCGLTSLDLSSCHALEILQVNDNKLASLAVSGDKLREVHGVRNQLTSFTATGTSALVVIWIHDNLLTTLDVSECATAMTCLGVCVPAEPELHGNPLQTLYVKNGQSFVEKYVPTTTNTVIK